MGAFNCPPDMEVNMFEDGDKPLEWRTETIDTSETDSEIPKKTKYTSLADSKSPAISNIFRRWIILEPSIFLFLASARMVYFTRQNLFIHVVCRHMNNMTEAECGNLTQIWPEDTPSLIIFGDDGSVYWVRSS